MSELVALHTQVVREPHLSPYLELLNAALRAARLNNAFPDRRRLQNTLRAMAPTFHGGVYDEIYVDSRTGLPNMAAVTRVLTDREVAAGSLSRLHDQAQLDSRREEAEVFEHLARKRRYLEQISRLEVAPIDDHRVSLRRHDPSTGTAMFRLDLTKLDATGLFIRVTIELTQVSSIWRRSAIDLDDAGETAEAREAFHSMIYRYAAFDAESLFVHLHELEGVTVDRVQRGVVGPVLFWLPGDQVVARPLELPDDALRGAWERWLSGPADAKIPHLLASFQSDSAARDIKQERSNDPLLPLLADRVQSSERARYQAARERFPFAVYKDRKFVVTKGARSLVNAICEAGGTKNLIYELR